MTYARAALPDRVDRRSARVASLVTSGTYIDAELAAEFGRLPPAFLPLGLGRLFQHQVEALRAEGHDLHLSLPSDFQLPEADRRHLEAAEVAVLRGDPKLSLGRAVHACMGALADHDAVEILHGDTLIRPPRPFAGDRMSVGDARDGYAWAAADVVDGRLRGVSAAPPDRSSGPHRIVLSGYFGFADPALFRALLEETGFDFVAALDRYVARRPVEAWSDERWLDFGHVQTYFRSRSQWTAARSFNHLQVRGGVVTKRSDHGAKLVGEAEWFRAVPPPARVYTARLVDVFTDERSFAYATEYEHLPSLAELYVFGRLNRPTWSRILDACAEYLALAATLGDPRAPDDALEHLAVTKTVERLEAHAARTGFPLEREHTFDGRPVPPVLRIVEELAGVVRAAGRRPATLMHGDLCFSNILYNSRVERIRLIDPRGSVRDTPTVYGDHRYDVAKLAHSIVGRYDLIVCGRATAARHGRDYALAFDDDPDKRWLEEQFAERTIAGERCGSPLTAAVMVSLFLSMLPLHADRPDRQDAFVANAFRLWLRYFGGSGSA